jgi:hypothetical protein
MRSRISFGVILAAGLLCALATPTLRWLSISRPDGALYGHIDAKQEKPPSLVQGFFDKSTQKWIENYFEVNLGFRAALIRNFNELNFALFKEAPRLRLYSTPERGLYSGMSIDSLNDEILHRTEKRRVYAIEAKKLLELQKMFEAQRKYFVVVIATSKPYVYPEGLGEKYLVGGDSNPFARAASFGQELAAQGVNVIDAGPLLRQYSVETGIETHPHSGVHWNYVAGCFIASKIMRLGQESMLPDIQDITCGEPRYAKPHMIDIDGLQLLNIWSNGSIGKPSPYPQITQLAPKQWRPKIVLIGDSFSDQIRYAFKESGNFSRIVVSNYFSVREVDDALNSVPSPSGKEIEVAQIRQIVLDDIKQSDVVILQMVDYNVNRLGYGFQDYVLNHRSKLEQ